MAGEGDLPKAFNLVGVRGLELVNREQGTGNEGMKVRE